MAIQQSTKGGRLNTKRATDTGRRIVDTRKAEPIRKAEPAKKAESVKPNVKTEKPSTKVTASATPNTTTLPAVSKSKPDAWTGASLALHDPTNPFGQGLLGDVYRYTEGINDKIKRNAQIRQTAAKAKPAQVKMAIQNPEYAKQTFVPSHLQVPAELYTN